MTGKALLWATLVLPVTAIAQDAPSGLSGDLDAYYLPNANVEHRATGAGTSDDVKGDGYGVRGLVHLSDLFMVTAEYQSTSYDQSTDDRTDYRLGGGIGSASGRALLLEYVNIDFGNSAGSGFGVHGRWAGHMVPKVPLHLQVGYVQVEDRERMGGFEFSVGGGYMFTRQFGAMLDYRLTNLEGAESQLELKLRDFRAGVRWEFGGAAPVEEASSDEGVGVEPVAGEGGEAPADAPVEEPAAGEAPAEEAPAEEATPG